MAIEFLGALIAVACAAAVWLMLRSGPETLRLASTRWRMVRHASECSPGLSRTAVLLIGVSRDIVAPAAVALQPHLSRLWIGAVDLALRRSATDRLLTPSEWCLLRVPAMLVISLAILVLDLDFIWLLASLALLGLLPWQWLRTKVKNREAAVLRELPFHLDMIALALEAGGTLNGALRVSLARSPPGPLREALQQLHAELQAGRGRIEALDGLRRRLDFGSTAPLIAALVQAERSGGSLAGVLRVQAEQRTHERFHRAEKLAMQAPVKMLGPLILCIFPCTFIVLGFVVWSSLGAGS
jgi:tight adherence protein C